MMRWIDVLTYAKYGNPEPPYKVEKTENEWQQLLTPKQYEVTRLKGTEPPYRNAYCRFYGPGNYVCVGCGSLLFRSETKYHAISGWPSFMQPASKGILKYSFDDSHNMHRIEVQCNVCSNHLGHVFNDGPEPARLRYCINSESLVLQEPDKDDQP
ncbi:peptide-methionine (R)-S-oxide reductase MsrB [Pontibacter cellulosilyticus]|uniref:peptide-methionine (R)-S-oxide reductase n=1 Tax=Pontibacter cellulosilyticus TaxID=1720253 RepID=A0A923N3S9_9BACT|nr:peptide-methionine (R)-S-oxide reductase MsrB [Pontibacter cellulosilyticus]MBC5991978.1 peptide-methionine (R)-S-oxide reductase MsrB [Pontibacter cellulosilyticus]